MRFTGHVGTMSHFSGSLHAGISPEPTSGEPGGTYPVMAALVSHVNKWSAVTSVSQYC